MTAEERAEKALMKPLHRDLCNLYIRGDLILFTTNDKVVVKIVLLYLNAQSLVKFWHCTVHTDLRIEYLTVWLKSDQSELRTFFNVLMNITTLSIFY